MMGWDDPFGLGFLLAMAGFAGCFALFAWSGRSKDPVKTAILSAVAGAGVMFLQSLSLWFGLLRDVRRAPQIAEKLDWPYAYGTLRDLPVDAALLWFSGLVAGVALSQILKLWLDPSEKKRLRENAEARSPA